MLENPYQAPQTPSGADEVLADDRLLPGHKPRIWTVFAVLLVAVACVLALSVIFGIVAVTLVSRSSASIEEFDARIQSLIESPLGFGFVLTLSQLPFLVVPIVASWLSPVPLRRRLGLVPSGLTWLQVAVVAAGIAAPFALGLGATYALEGVVESDHTIQRAFGNVTWPALLPFVAVVALVPGFAEEVLFRGYMQRRLLERWPPWVAIGFTALCFALVHLEMHAGIFSLPPGIWLGWVAWKTNSLWPGIVSHIAALGCWALTACFMHLTGVEAVPHWLTLFAVVVAFAVTLWAVWILQTHFGPAKAAVLLQD